MSSGGGLDVSAAKQAQCGSNESTHQVKAAVRNVRDTAGGAAVNVKFRSDPDLLQINSGPEVKPKANR